MANRYDKLEKQINVKFKSENILENVFTHRAYINENRKWPHEHNDRLEFLGDAVLELVATDYLFKTFPTKGEGALTTFRSALVKGDHLAKISTQLNLGVYLYLSRGEEKTGGRKKDYILANALEALIGAIYLDQGYTAAHNFIDEFILQELSEILSLGLHLDAKSKLQEQAQEKMEYTPVYKVLKDEGPDHDKTFTMGVYIQDKLVAKGTGSSKQKAETAAAEAALKKLGLK